MYQSEEEEEEDEILYEVEKILGVRYNKEKHKVQFLIKWKNYDSRCDNTWEQEENLECPMLLKQFWDTLNIGPDRKKWMYEGKEKKLMIPSIESQDVIYLDDDDDDDDFTDDLFYPPQPKASQPVSVLQPKPDNHHVSRTREEKGKQRYQPPQQQQQQIRQLPQNQKMMDRQQEQYLPSQKKSYLQEKRPRSSSAIPTSSSSITSSLMTSSSPSISTPTYNMSPRARLEAEVNARIGKSKSEAPMQRRPIKNINIVSYKNRMLSESRASSSSPIIQTPIRKRPHHRDDYLTIKASKTEKKQSPTSFADIDTLFNKIQDNKKDRHISRYD
ncbi:hypothetical protein INT45_006056 [Circinella minor]|uniref:Chromo domain-containing protein n=1 Tax=Circinella minor TaxID=1195481 RepID=A0A8H7RZ67_9FUNG|nr:hypothetical protein INT45_006056 [Circinella minor]